MPININDNLDIQAPKPQDNRYGPYTSTSVALASIPTRKRYLGLKVGIIINGVVTDYWFRSGILDNNLTILISPVGVGSTGPMGPQGPPGPIGLTGSSSNESGGFGMGDIQSDEIRTEEDAARFLAMTTLGGPTPTEIADLVALGSKNAWLTDQMVGCYDGSEFAEWGTENGQLVMKQGWFGGVGMLMAPPSNYITGPQLFNDNRPTTIMLIAMIGSAFMRNNPTTGGLFSTTDPNAKKSPNKTLLCKVTWILHKLLPLTFSGGAFGGNGGYHWDSLSVFSSLSHHAFGKYEDLLEEWTYSLTGSRMLTYYNNQKESETGNQPDENMSREIMQLMTLGLYLLDDGGRPVLGENGQPIENYNNADVFQLAKVFTGLTRGDQPDNDYYASTPSNTIRNGDPWGVMGHTFTSSTTRYGTRKPPSRIVAGKRYRIHEVGNTPEDLISVGADSTPASGEIFLAVKDGTEFMVNGLVEEQRISPAGIMDRLKHVIAYYETGEKTPPNLGFSIPSGMDPETNITTAIRALVRHPSTAPYICQRLIRMAVTSNPSPAYVSRVVKKFRDNGRGEVGDLAAVWDAIFTDPEANSSTKTSETFGRILDPFELCARFMRPFDGTQVTTFPSSDEPGWSSFDMFLNGVYLTGKRTGFVGTPTMAADFEIWPLNIGSIFGPYPPEYTVSPADGWGQIIPEMGAWPSSRITKVYNRIIDIATRGPNGFRTSGGNVSNYYTHPSYDASLGDLTTTSPQVLVDKLNLILCGGKLNNARKKIMVDTITPLPTATVADRENRVKLLIQALAATREAWIQ